MEYLLRSTAQPRICAASSGTTSCRQITSGAAARASLNRAAMRSSASMGANHTFHVTTRRVRPFVSGGSSKASKSGSAQVGGTGGSMQSRLRSCWRARDRTLGGGRTATVWPSRSTVRCRSASMMCFAMELFHAADSERKLANSSTFRDFEVTRGPQVCDVHVRVHVLAQILKEAVAKIRALSRANRLAHPNRKLAARALEPQPAASDPSQFSGQASQRPLASAHGWHPASAAASAIELR
eukprot:scaffold78211_cov63-Phaeocystis_antarctica.AAC.2